MGWFTSLIDTLTGDVFDFDKSKKREAEAARQRLLSKQTAIDETEKARQADIKAKETEKATQRGRLHAKGARGFGGTILTRGLGEIEEASLKKRKLGG